MLGIYLLVQLVSLCYSSCETLQIVRWSISVSYENTQRRGERWMEDWATPARQLETWRQILWCFCQIDPNKRPQIKLKNLGFSVILKFDLDSNSLLTEWLIVTLTDPSPDLAIPLLLDARQEKNEDNKNNVESKLETGASWWLVHVCIVLTVL